MFRVLTSICLILSASVGFAKPESPMYQVDMIVFAHQQDPSQSTESEQAPLRTRDNGSAIALQTSASNDSKFYHTLPVASSRLRNEYWALHRKPQYKVLFHYSWLQPGNNKKTIALPAISRDGWDLEGTVRIRKGNYYLLDTDLIVSSPDNNNTPLVFAQKQRLKDGVTYYLDHPKAGMLIKVHRIT